jgi:hypothetical protein
VRRNVSGYDFYRNGDLIAMSSKRNALTQLSHEFVRPTTNSTNAAFGFVWLRLVPTETDFDVDSVEVGARMMIQGKYLNWYPAVCLSRARKLSSHWTLFSVATIPVDGPEVGDNITEGNDRYDISNCR